MINIIKSGTYILYLKWIRHRIYNIKTEKDVYKIIKNIEYFFVIISSSDLCEILIDCFNRYPLEDRELMQLSILQQRYSQELGLYNYITFIIWISSQHSIEELSQRLLH